MVSEPLLTLDQIHIQLEFLKKKKNLNEWGALFEEIFEILLELIKITWIIRFKK